MTVYARRFVLNLQHNNVSRRCLVITIIVAINNVVSSYCFSKLGKKKKVFVACKHILKCMMTTTFASY